MWHTFSDKVFVSALSGRYGRKKSEEEEQFTAIVSNPVHNMNAPLDRLLDVQSGMLFGSAKSPGWPDAFSSMCALVLAQSLAVNEAFPTFSTFIGSLSSVKPVVDLQFLGPGVAFPTYTTNEWSVFDVGLVMSR